MAFVKVLRQIPWQNLEEMLHGVTLQKPDEHGEDVFPYREARIGLREVRYEELNPLSFYLNQKNLETQRRLLESLRAQGLDPFHLEGGLEILNEEDGDEWTLVPPIIEVSKEHVAHRKRLESDIDYGARSTTLQTQIIVDGLHRFWVARERDEPVRVIHISGVPEITPVYAFPNGWDEVRVFTDTPATMAQKKKYRSEDHYKFYRNFNILGNVSHPRHTGEGVVKSG